MPIRFEGIWVPIVTPFVENQIDFAALARLGKHLACHDIAGIVVGATTGEGMLLTSAERVATLQTLRAAVPSCRIIQGVSAVSTQEAVAQIKALTPHGPDAFLITPPAYLRPSQAGVQKHFEILADASSRPILLYNIPYRTGVDLSLPVLQSLSEHPNIVGIKECGSTPMRLMQLTHQTPLCVLSGDDALNFSAYCLGAHGAISAAAHILPTSHIQLWQLVKQGQIHAARQIAWKLAPLIDALFREPNPAPLKAWLAQQGWCTPEVRLPFVPATMACAAEVLAAWVTLNENIAAKDSQSPLQVQ